jgi:pSer/pThr/pTyr-binding forkhead associated (FHA) protein
MVKLVISDDAGATTVVPLVRDEISIGRGEGNTIRLTERNVSRKHAQLKRNGETFILCDLGSYNGVLVNGKPIVDEIEVNPGDRIRIGDYFLMVEAEGETQAEAQDREYARDTIPITETSPAVTTTPARLVLLTEPIPGVEFSLRKNSTIRIGRGEDLDIPIVHSSVSREHAEIRVDEEEVHISDLGSVNGLCINGNRIDKSVLKSGDLVELGEVVLRYVAAGESYQFDPSEAARYLKKNRGLSRQQLQIGAAVVAIAAFLLVVIVWSQGGDSTNVTELVDVQQESRSEVAERDAIKRMNDEAFARALGDCRAALDGSRFAEAIAYAKKALEKRPSDKAAGECKQAAERRLEQEQIFVRGKAALDHGDAEGAYLEFQKLDSNSGYEQKPEVGRAIEEFARSQIDLAWALIKSDKKEAARLAATVMAIADAPAEFYTAAREIQDTLQKQESVSPSARFASTTKAKRRSSVVKNPRRPAKAPSNPKAVEKRVSTASKTEAKAGEKGGMGRFREASACLARGDNRCIIRLLAGKAKTAAELGLLIETYRSIGDSKNALANMALYVKRFPTSRRTASYQRILERNSK